MQRVKTAVSELELEVLVKPTSICKPPMINNTSAIEQTQITKRLFSGEMHTFRPAIAYDSSFTLPMLLISNVRGISIDNCSIEWKK